MLSSAARRTAQPPVIAVTSNGNEGRPLDAAMKEIKADADEKLAAEVEKHKLMLEDLADKVNSLVPRTMESLVVFVDVVNNCLSELSDESKVLQKTAAWPADRWDAMVNAVTKYRELRKLMESAAGFPGQLLGSSATYKVNRDAAILSMWKALEKELGSSHEMLVKACTLHRLPIMKDIEAVRSELRTPALAIVDALLQLVVVETQRLRSTTTATTNAGSIKRLLSEAVEFAVNVHKKVEGFPSLEYFNPVWEALQPLL